MNVAVTRVGDLAEQVRGVSYAKEDASTVPLPGYLPVLRAGNITDEGLVFDDLVFVPAGRISSTQKLRRHDVVIAASSGSLEVVGKAAPVLSDFEGSFGAFCKVLRPNASVDPSYFAHFFKTQDYRRRVSELAAGVNINNLRNEHIDELRIPLPHLADQKRIAAILDRADELRAKRRAALTQLDNLTKSIFLDAFGDPARNTKGFPTSSLGELGKWQSGGTPPREREDYFDGSVPWFSSGELNEMVVVQSKEHISHRALHETSAKPVPQGALMLGMYDTAALKASIAGVPCACNQAIAFAQIDPQLAETLFVFFAIVIGREHFRRLQRGVRQKNLNLSMICELRIPIPSLSVQREFTHRVRAIEKLKMAHSGSLAELDALFAALQKHAFRGEL